MIPRSEVLSALWRDTPAMTLGLLILATGLAALALDRLRTQSRDVARLWFGVMCIAYSVRLLLEAGIVRFMLGMPTGMHDYISATLTYLIPLPALFFTAEVMPERRRTMRRLTVGWSIFAAIAILADVLRQQPYTLGPVNDGFVLVLAVWLAIALFRGQISGILRSLRWGLLVFLLTAVVANLAGVAILRLPFNPEPVGFAVFVISLGMVLARRAASREQKLIAIEQELEFARRIQLSILPREMPASKRLRVAARYLPMTAVAGDFYEFLVVDEGHVGILIADVSGHGVPAALIASMVKVAIAAQLPHAEDPARVIRGMNEVLSGKLQGQFVTAAYLFLDLDAGVMRYAAAGHPALLWMRAGGVEEVEQNGMVLGFFARAPYTSVERTVAAGDRFLLYTDGLVEATNGGEDYFGAERLRDALLATSPRDADAAVAAVLDRLSSWSGRVGVDQEDDLTVVCVDVVAG